MKHLLMFIGLLIPDTMIKDILTKELLYNFNKNRHLFDYRFDFTSYIGHNYYQYSKLIDNLLSNKLNRYLST